MEVSANGSVAVTFNKIYFYHPQPPQSPSLPPTKEKGVGVNGPLLRAAPAAVYFGM